MRMHELAGSGQSLAQRERLLKAATGKWVGWREMTVLLLGALQFLLGAAALLVLGPSAASILPLATGAIFVALAIWLILNARIDALLELVNTGTPT